MQRYKTKVFSQCENSTTHRGRVMYEKSYFPEAKMVFKPIISIGVNSIQGANCGTCAMRPSRIFGYCCWSLAMLTRVCLASDNTFWKKTILMIISWQWLQGINYFGRSFQSNFNQSLFLSKHKSSNLTYVIQQANNHSEVILVLLLPSIPYLWSLCLSHIFCLGKVHLNKVELFCRGWLI